MIVGTVIYSSTWESVKHLCGGMMNQHLTMRSRWVWRILPISISTNWSLAGWLLLVVVKSVSNVPNAEIRRQRGERVAFSNGRSANEYGHGTGAAHRH